MRSLLLLGLLALSSCGDPKLGSPCQATCDCKETTAPESCPGEWVCNAQKACEYRCKGGCGTGAPYTCRDGEECNGSICSERQACR
jgi:hypothetical protein